MSTIFTIGYERSDFVSFAQALAKSGIDTVIDVRAEPHSRRREFSFKYLGPQLSEYGISYESWPILGAPPTAREAGKSGDIALFYQLYMEHLASAETSQAMLGLSEHMASERICLMCYERQAERCHRALVAGAMKHRHGAVIRHLVPD